MKAIIIYDGDCALCNSTIRWVLKHDNNFFQLADQHSEYYKDFAHKYLDNKYTAESVYLVHGDRYYKHSDAIIQILKYCGRQGKIYSAIIKIFPRFIQIRAYKLVALNRKRIGKYCKIMNTEDIKNRLVN